MNWFGWYGSAGGMVSAHNLNIKTFHCLFISGVQVKVDGVFHGVPECGLAFLGLPTYSHVGVLEQTDLPRLAGPSGQLQNFTALLVDNLYPVFTKAPLLGQVIQKIKKQFATSQIDLKLHFLCPDTYMSTYERK